MKTLVFCMMLSAAAVHAGAQTYRMTFTGKGDAGRIDWVKATNLNSNESITVRGDEYLTVRVVIPTLEPGSGGGSVPGYLGSGTIYPNPFIGTTRIVVDVGERQEVDISVRNFAGQLVASHRETAESGGNEFAVSVAEAGFYLITATTREGTVCYKAVSSQAANCGNAIRFTGVSVVLPSSIDADRTKGGIIKDYLKMKEGDVILYTCVSGSMTVLMTDVPNRSRDYGVKFSACTDAAGLNYPVVNVGGQTWMASNLAWLPGVDRPTEGSFKEPQYYVYGYQGDNLAKAKSLHNYSTYGALYNFAAARTACPKGWRLPTDLDWIALERSLGMEPKEALKTGWRNTGGVGCLLKEPGTSHWASSDFSVPSVCGFLAIPGGYLLIPVPALERTKEGMSVDGVVNGFNRLGQCSFFWTSTSADETMAFNRRLGCSADGVQRIAVPKSFGYSVRCIKNVAVEELVDD